jgi:hypothetical protein
MQNDPNNCGACGSICGAQACNAGSCGPAAPLINVSVKVSQLMNDLALDGSYVYWAETGNVPGYLFRAPIGGGPGSAVASDSNAVPLTLSAGTLFYGSGSYGTGNTAVRRVSAAGGAVTNIALNTGDLVSIAVDSSSVYWTTYVTYNVVKGPIAGGAPIVLAGSRPSLPHHVAVDATNVYWVEGADIFFVPKGGGAPAALISGISADLMILQGGFLYYSVNKGVGAPGTGIFRVPVSGGTPVAIATGLLLVSTLTTDGTTVYWSDGTNDLNILRRAPAAGGGRFVSLTGYTTTSHSSAMDASYVYWNDTRAIYKIAR